MHGKLETRPHPKKENRVQVNVNGRWKSHKDFSLTCWGWTRGEGFVCDSTEFEYWAEGNPDNPVIMRRCLKCGHIRKTRWGYPSVKPPAGGFQHGWLRTRRACAGY